jgi:hypothetical protein
MVQFTSMIYLLNTYQLSWELKAYILVSKVTRLSLVDQKGEVELSHLVVEVEEDRPCQAEEEVAFRGVMGEEEEHDLILVVEVGVERRASEVAEEVHGPAVAEEEVVH